MARMNLMNTVGGPDQTGAEYATMPNWFKTWEKTGLLKFDDKNQDGKIQYYNDKTKNEAILAAATEKGWKGNELTVDRDIMVLANPEIAGLPNWVIALVAAGGIAAALSTAAGLLLVISSSISHDLMKSIMTKNLSERGELLSGRIAIAGMLSGLVFTLGYIIYFKRDVLLGMPAVPSSEWLFGISPEGIGTIGMLLNFAVAWVVSRITPPPPEHIQHLVEDIRVPRGAGEAVAH
jgi:cation/acetate symporter